VKIVTAKNLLKANEQLAAANRARFEAAGLFVVNLVGSPGCGKTTLITALARRLKEKVHMGVIEGDIAGSVDAEKIAALQIPVVQINTDGACHLDANMVSAAVADLDLKDLDLLVIENVGNLVCTAGFDLGEHLRVVVLSVPEGDDKLVKYPAIFQGSHALVITKVDLAPHVSFSTERVAADMKRLAPQAVVFQVAALRDEGIEPLAEFLIERSSQYRAGTQ